MSRTTFGERPASSVSRRHFLHECGYGLGKIALAGLLTGAWIGPRPRHRRRLAEPAGPEEAALPAQGQGGNPSLHGRGAEPVGNVRLQAGAGQDRREAAAAVGHRRAALRLHPARRGRARAPLQVRPARPMRGRAFRDAAAPGQGGRRPLPLKSVHTDQFNHAPAQIFFNSGFAQPGRPSMGSWVLYGLGAEAKDLPAFVVMSTGPASAAARPTGPAASCPRSMPACGSATAAIPILDVASPAGCDANFQRDTLHLVTISTASVWRRSATRRSPRGSAPMKWPCGCKPRPRS